MAENSIIDYSNIIGDDGSFKKLFAELDKLEDRLERITKNTKSKLDLVNPNETEKIKELEKAVNNYEKAQKNINQQRKVAIRQRKQLNDLTEEELINREAEKITNRERVQRAKQLAIIRKEEKNNIASLRAQLSLVTLDWKKLTKEEANNGKEGKALVRQKKQLTDQLKRLEKATGDNRREVGNYTLATKGLSSTLKRLFVGRTIADGILRISGALGDVIEKNKDTNEELGKLSETFAIIKNVAEDLAVSFLELVASPISNFLLNVGFAIEKIRNFFEQARESTGFFSGAITFLGKALELPLVPIRALIGLLSDFPAVIGGAINVFREFSSVANSTFENVGIRAKRAFLQVERALKSIAGADVRELDDRIANLTLSLEANQQAGQGLFAAYSRGYNDVKQQQEEFNKAQSERVKEQEKETKKYKAAEKARTKALEKELKERNKLLDSFNKNNTTRLEIIQKLQKQIEGAEIGNIEDRQTKLLALEDKAFKEQQAQRDNNFNLFISNLEKQEELLISLYGENSKEVIGFRDKAGKEILEVEKLNQQLEAEQLEASEKKKLEIRKKFALERQKEAEKTLKEGADFLDKLFEEQDKKEIDQQKEQEKKELDRISKNAALNQKAQDDKKAQNDQFFDDLIKTSEKVSDLINKQFEATTNAATNAVESQAKAVETQRQRAEDGLSNTLKFEEEELARKEAERQRAEKRQQDAAKLLALYSLVAAYAQNGDEKALQRALVDFAALEVASGAIQGFYEGTENVGNSLGDNNKAFNTGRDDYLGMTKKGSLFRFDGTERIVNGLDNSKLGNMSNTDLVNNALLGMQISDNNSYMNADAYNGHFNKIKATLVNNTIVDLSPLEQEMKMTRKAIMKQEKKDFDIEKITDMFLTISKKTTKGLMTKKEQIKKRL